MTLKEKYEARQRYVKGAFAFMVGIPIASLGLLAYGISPEPASTIFATSSSTFAALILGHFATTPKNNHRV